jgi:hypothetical protein
LQKPKNKFVILTLSKALLCMSAMLATQQAMVTKVTTDGVAQVHFAFAARQSFSLSFAGDRLMDGLLSLVEDREPTRQALARLHVDDVASLFQHHMSDQPLQVIVRCDDGVDLARSDVMFKEMQAAAKYLTLVCLRLVMLPDSSEDLFADIAETRVALVREHTEAIAA